MQKWSYFCLDHFVLHAGYVLNTLLRIRIININPRSIAIEKLYLVILVFWKVFWLYVFYMELSCLVLLQFVFIMHEWNFYRHTIIYVDSFYSCSLLNIFLMSLKCSWYVMSLKCNYKRIISSSLVNTPCVIFNYGK